MKTIEEKARAYDEVLNKLRHFIAKGVDPLITRADVQDFFPELAESEDEKVRKEIVRFIQMEVEDEIVGNKWLAWLGKQGEHANFRNKIQVDDKVTRNEDGVLVNLSQLKRVAKPSEKQDEKHPDPYNGISFEYNGHIWGMCARDNGVDISCDKRLIKHLEKQGEQKPADTAEPKFKVGDKIYLKPEYRMPDDDTPIANTVKEIRGIDDKHYRFDGSYIFIEDQDKYALVEQKPAWSEEDSRNEYVNWLKSLRPQNK